MKIRSLIIPLIVLTLLFGSSCETTKEDVQKYLNQGDYEQVYSFLEKSISDRRASINDLDVTDKTAFETGFFGLLPSNSAYASKAADLVSNNHQRIENSQNLEPLLWSYLSEHKTAPKGVYTYLYDTYDFRNPDAQTLSWFQTDSVFLGLLKADLSQTIHENIFATNDLRMWAKAGGFDEILEILDEISRLLREKNAAQGSIHRIDTEQDEAIQFAGSRLSSMSGDRRSLERRIDFLEEQINPGLDESFIFRGYMIALIDRFTITGHPREVYEVRDYYGNIRLLITTETSFQSKGTFSMRVQEFLEIPMQLKQEYGGFNRNIKSYVEVGSSNWSDYLADKAELEDLKTQLSRLNNQIQRQRTSSSNANASLAQTSASLKEELNEEIRVLENQIRSKRRELVDWANTNTSK